MSFLYPYLGNVTASLNSASYFNETDYKLFVSGFQEEFWYGLSKKDSIEFSVYNLNKDLLSWKSVENIGSYNVSQLSYYDYKNNAVPYEYRQFQFNLPLFKTEKILLEPVTDVSSSNLPPGNYILGYQFTRYLAGSPSSPLIIKDISPSRKELKLIPLNGSSKEYTAYCVGKIPLDDLSPLYISLIKNCDYDKVYKNSQLRNEDAIVLLKNMFFIPNDGKFVEFLKSIYEDNLLYSKTDSGGETFTRIQGIKSYFNNFLISNTDQSFYFNEIKEKFDECVSIRLKLLFVNFKSENYNSAKNYLFDVFTKHYFDKIHDFLEKKYKDKFSGPLKNALSFGSGKYIPIINSSYIDERKQESDPLTLLVKLQSGLPNELSTKSSVWISNISNIPFLFNAIVKERSKQKTYKISSPDFSISVPHVSFLNSGDYQSKEDLDKESSYSNEVSVSKKISELNVDYSSFRDFIIFSSAELRHKIFKNKMISIAGVDRSLLTLNSNYSSSGYTYQYYSTEKESIENVKKEIIDSFDGFESYLYKTGYYNYSLDSKSFSNSSFVEDMDYKSSTYDKSNRDSLVNNTPEYIVNDSENDDYLIFLSMMGHYFDNLMLYIKSLPSQKSSENSNDISKNVLQQMLQSFGWNLNSSLEELNISENFLDTELGGSAEYSAEERTRQAWSRILNNLPLIYKSKGTEECIRLVLSCYGIPSTLLSIREYGGIDYDNLNKTTYNLEEKIFMLTFKGYREYLSIPFDPSIKTVEMKVALDPTLDYKTLEKIPLAVKHNQYNTTDWELGVYKEKGKYLGRAYFQLPYKSYKIGVVGDYGIYQNSNTQSLRVANSLTSVNPDFLISTGDNIYQTNTKAFDDLVGRLYRQFIYPYSGVSGSGAKINRFFPVIGNHDNDIPGDVNYSYYTSFFTNLTPWLNDTGSVRPHYRYYTFKKGNVQFFCLNSDTNEPDGITPTSVQGQWFKQQLSGSFADKDVLWRIAVFHHPWISSGVVGHLGSWMSWPWSSYGIDVCLTGHDHFYERLEDNNVTLIIQGAGGASLYSFPNNPPQSKFRWNSSHGYSIIESKGNKLVFSLYDMYGNFIPDTGTSTLPSHSIVNGSLVIEKNLVPFSDKPFQMSDKFILSDVIPIFNGEIFNLMVRKNELDNNFEYNSVENIVPTKYDLKVQKNENGITIFSSSKSEVFTKTYNEIFSDVGDLYFGNYENSSSFKGQLDKILIYDSTITDDTFTDHCNNINSYSYTGSFENYQTLYFRMNFDYPRDLSLSNPSIIINQNETYSSSIWMEAHNFGIQAFSSSIDNCFTVSHSAYPYQFKEISYNQTFVINNYGPNRFKNQKIKPDTLELTSRLDPDHRSSYSKKFITSDSNQIGLFIDPNDYKNKDIFKYLGSNGVTDLIADPSQMFLDKYYPLKQVRDSYNESGNKKTYYNEMFTLYKFYFDKSVFETIKQLIPSRNTILSGILIEPTVLERPKYAYKPISSDIGDCRTTKSVSICEEMTNDSINRSVLSVNGDVPVDENISSQFISANFRLERDIYASQLYQNIPFYITEGPYETTNPLYQRFLSLKSRLQYVEEGWIKKYPDIGEIGVVEQHPDWPIPAQDYGPEGIKNNPFYLPNNYFLGPAPGYYLSGSGYFYLNKCYFYTKTDEKLSSTIDNLQKNLSSTINLLPDGEVSKNYPDPIRYEIIKDIENEEELGVHCDDCGRIIETILSGSYKRYLIKKWNKNKLWNLKENSAVENVFVSQSFYTNYTEVWQDPVYSSLIYTSSFQRISTKNPFNNSVGGDYSPRYSENGGVYTFYYEMGTFKDHPDVTRNDLYTLSRLNESGKYQYNVVRYDGDFYYETFKGYPRNHLTHKKITFTKESHPGHVKLKFDTYTSSSLDNKGRTQTFQFSRKNESFERYIKSRQTQKTTINEDGLEDNSIPIQTVNVSNVNVVKTENVLS